MEPSDLSIDEVSLHPTWMALGHRVAVAAGASAALISLLGDVPLLVASRRGLFAWLATFALARCFAWLLARTVVPPADEPGEGEMGEPAAIENEG
ncbi:MAG: hypothetical protein GY711_04380 [bacterium]|nr:hypothetical protein [bacterium]